MFQPSPEVRLYYTLSGCVNPNSKGKHVKSDGTVCSVKSILLEKPQSEDWHGMQVADEYLKGVLNAAAKESHSVEIPDVTAALQSGESMLL